MAVSGFCCCSWLLCELRSEHNIGNELGVKDSNENPAAQRGIVMNSLLERPDIYKGLFNRNYDISQVYLPQVVRFSLLT